MIVSVPSSARGEEPVTGASISSTPPSASTAPTARASSDPIVDMSTHNSPSAAPLSTPCSPVSTEATCSPSTTMLTTMSLRWATSAGVAQAAAPRSAAQRSALPGVWVHTVRG